MSSDTLQVGDTIRGFGDGLVLTIDEIDENKWLGRCLYDATEIMDTQAPKPRENKFINACKIIFKRRIK